MCPVCISTLAIVMFGFTPIGGLTAIVMAGRGADPKSGQITRAKDAQHEAVESSSEIELPNL